MAATQGHTQSLHTNALDRRRLPTDLGPHRPATPSCSLFSRSPAPRTVDPWAGSAYVERLTQRTGQQGVGADRRGRGRRRHGQGRSRPASRKMRIGRGRARTQARILRQQRSSGVNKYRSSTNETWRCWKVDNNARCATRQIAKLERLRADSDQCGRRRARLRSPRLMPGRSGRDLSTNLPALAIDAARAGRRRSVTDQRQDGGGLRRYTAQIQRSGRVQRRG